LWNHAKRWDGGAYVKKEAERTGILLVLERETGEGKVDLRSSGFKGILSRVAHNADNRDVVPVLLLKRLRQRILISSKELFYPRFIHDGDGL
jgi:hypothetical protein